MPHVAQTQDYTQLLWRMSHGGPSDWTRHLSWGCFSISLFRLHTASGVTLHTGKAGPLRPAQSCRHVAHTWVSGGREPPRRLPGLLAGFSEGGK